MNNETNKVLSTAHYQPSFDLYAKVRSCFVAQGTSLNAWCIGKGISRQNARKSLLGEWDGPKSRRLRKRLLIAVNLDNT